MVNSVASHLSHVNEKDREVQAQSDSVCRRESGCPAKEKERGTGWISWQETTQRHECSTGAADVAQFLAVSRWEATKLIPLGDLVNEKNSARSCLESKSRYQISLWFRVLDSNPHTVPCVLLCPGSQGSRV